MDAGTADVIVRLRCVLALSGPKRLGVPGVEAYGFRPFHEFDYIDPLLAGLDIRNIVLPAFQALGEINLA